jgi:hypothetical protein
MTLKELKIWVVAVSLPYDIFRARLSIWTVLVRQWNNIQILSK